eukprot:1128446-Prorocentrum_minimum.AAC.2
MPYRYPAICNTKRNAGGAVSRKPNPLYDGKKRLEKGWKKDNVGLENVGSTKCWVSSSSKAEISESRRLGLLFFEAFLSYAAAFL